MHIALDKGRAARLKARQQAAARLGPTRLEVWADEGDVVSPVTDAELAFESPARADLADLLEVLAVDAANHGEREP